MDQLAGRGGREMAGLRLSDRSVLLLAGIAAATIIVGYRALAALWPSLGDQALFLFFGQRMNAGATLYVDIWDLKPPVIYLVNALAARFADPLAALAVIESLALLAGAAALAATLRLAGARPLPIAAGLLSYALLVSYNAIAEGGNYTECYVIPFAGLSMLLWVRGLLHDSAASFAGAGAAACFAAAAKLPGMAPLLAGLALLALTALIPGRAGAALKAGLAACAGFLLALAAILGAGALLTDLSAMLDGSIIHPIQYAQKPVPGSGHSLADQLYVLAALAAPVLLALGAALAGLAGLAGALRQAPAARPSLLVPGLAPRQFTGLFALWAFADLAGALGTGRNYGHYFLPLAASASAAAAMLVSIAGEGSRRWGRILLGIWLVGSAVTALNGARMVRWQVTARDPGVTAAVPASQKALLEAIERHARPGDRLAVWENQHALYLASGLTNALPHLAMINGADSDHAVRTKAPAILAALRRCPPRFLVLSPLASDVPGAVAFHGGIRDLAGRLYRPVPLRPEAAPHRLFVRRAGPGPGCPA